MTVEADIAALEAELTRRATEGTATRIRDGNRETEIAVVSESDLRRRLAELRAQLAGQPARPAARRVFF